ncbi:hypothetical protein BDB00DRAFT_762607 [Zychaea mexicana]|uniref:uncharacterized protein n=1 Tax=Zychaea mexicana TaxID=64656 RepID=UPI0022FEB2A5|nr:uncharacterized protein BDB00DRAFT_762607 [Zychaea mexicana]KAI9494060.1 hypothetical protein BDB00DRAFT_762607 [Zychaea mexicana]
MSLSNAGRHNLPPSEEKQKRLFVGGIAPGINDDWIELLLKAGGNLKSWKRMKDPQGNMKGFGFAEYEDAESVLRVLRVLGGENDTHDGLVLKARDDSSVEKKLLVKADDNVREFLQQHQTAQPDTEIETKDKDALTKIYAYVDAINRGQDPASANNNAEDDSRMTDASPTAAAAEGEEGTEPKEQDTNGDNDLLNKELAFFKERAAQRDQEKQRIREVQEERRARSPSPSDYNRRRRRPTEHAPPQEEIDIDDEELERRRIEKHEKDVELAFRQRERRFEGRERTRLHDYERDLERLKEAEERQARNKEYWATKLAEWDDDVEIEKGEVEFYTNRSRWRRHREGVRRREEERDEEDRRLEAQEIEEERLRIEHEERMARQQQQREQREKEREEEKQQQPLKPTKLSFNAPIKRISAMGGGDDEDDEEGGGRKRRVLVPLDYGDEDVTMSEASTTTTSMDPEERATKLKELIGSIPSSEQELWNWPVKWDQVDEALIEEKLKPFISKKITEIVGAEDDEFVGFILDFVRRQQTPDTLVKELEMTLDAEALVFVMKLWRALIFESERKSAKL